MRSLNTEAKQRMSNLHLGKDGLATLQSEFEAGVDKLPPAGQMRPITRPLGNKVLLEHIRAH